MKKLYIQTFILFLLIGCTNNQTNIEVTPTPTPSQEPVITEITSLPEKEIPDSPLASDSPLSSENIDDYLFLKDVMYVDLRSFEQQLTEGSIAGFKVIPFYEVIVWWENKENVLYTMKKPEEGFDSYLGDEGSFFPNYQESEEVLNSIFPKNKQIVFMSTAGVEAAYMINLLKQCGYDASLLYNAGTFTNAIGDTKAYMNLEDHKYYIEPNSTYNLHVKFDWGELTPIE